jgi:hypothetical protein
MGVGPLILHSSRTSNRPVDPSGMMACLGAEAKIPIRRVTHRPLTADPAEKGYTSLRSTFE